MPPPGCFPEEEVSAAFESMKNSLVALMKTNFNSLSDLVERGFRGKITLLNGRLLLLSTRSLGGKGSTRAYFLEGDNRGNTRLYEELFTGIPLEYTPKKIRPEEVRPDFFLPTDIIFHYRPQLETLVAACQAAEQPVEERVAQPVPTLAYQPAT